MITVHALRKSGYKVRIEHYRKYFDPINKRYCYLTKHLRELSELPSYVTMKETSGYTVVTITNTEGITTQGKSECSKHDLYEKKTGVRIAMDIALKEMGEYIMGRGVPPNEDPQLVFPFYNECHCTTKCTLCNCESTDDGQ